MLPRRSVAVIIFVLCALGVTGCGAQGAPTEGLSAQSDVRLTLTSNLVASPARTFVFVAEIAGGADNDPALYCQATTWGYGDGPALTMTPSCAPYSPDVRITRRFETTHTYEAAGRYEVTLAYGPLRAQQTVEAR